jgi:hypothetical protein
MKYKARGLSKLRARYHDYNSQRRYRGKSTVDWASYVKKTAGGRRKFSKL